VQAKAKGPQPEAKDEADEEALDADAHDLPPISDLDSERVRKLGRDKLSYKRRGSISKSISSQLPGGEVIIPAYSRTANRLQAGKGTKKKQKPKKLKVIADVFIPSTVSVGQLAKLLNVRMGVYRVIHFSCRPVWF
jgi:translation initiation factor IF-2